MHALLRSPGSASRCGAEQWKLTANARNLVMSSSVCSVPYSPAGPGASPAARVHTVQLGCTLLQFRLGLSCCSWATVRMGLAEAAMEPQVSPSTTMCMLLHVSGVGITAAAGQCEAHQNSNCSRQADMSSCTELYRSAVAVYLAHDCIWMP